MIDEWIHVEVCGGGVEYTDVVEDLVGLWVEGRGYAKVGRNGG